MNFMFFLKILYKHEHIDRNCFFHLRSSEKSVWTGYQKVLILTKDNTLMEQVIYGLCKC